LCTEILSFGLEDSVAGASWAKQVEDHRNVSIAQLLNLLFTEVTSAATLLSVNRYLNAVRVTRQSNGDDGLNCLRSVAYSSQ